MANSNRIRVDIDGDESGLNRSLKSASESIEKFSDSSGELLGGLGDGFSSLTSKIGGLGSGLTGLAGGIGLVTGGVVAMVMASNDYVKSLNEISRSSGLTVTELQQLQTVFQGLGLDTEKYGDINRDVLDHLGDAFRDGSGPAEDMKAYGLNLKDFNKYLNQADGGIKALANAFYNMKAAGKSTAEITNMLETMGSDGSKLVDVMQQYSNATDLMNAVYSTHAQLTDENARKYQEFDKTVTTLSTSFQLWKANALTPTVEELNKILAVMNGDKWTNNGFMDMMREFYYGGDNAIAKGLRKLDGVGEVGYSIKATATLDKNASDLLNFVNNNTGTKNTTPKDGWVNKEKEAAAAAAAQKKAEAAAKSAADKAAAAAKKQAADRITAQASLNKAISDMTIDSNARQLAEFDRQQHELVLSIQKSAKTLGLSQGKINDLLSQQQISSVAKRTDMVNQMIGYSYPNQGLKDTNNLLQNGNLNSQQTGFLAPQQNQRINGDNPFNFDDTDQKQKDNTDALNAELAQNDLLLKGHEDYEKRKAEITAKYNAQAIDIANQNAQNQLTVFSKTADSLSDGMVAAFGEASGAAQAAFAISKGITMAQTVLSIQSALAQALATPFPASLAAYAQVLSLGMNIISTAKGASKSNGQFHGGVDELPSSLDNKSFVLKAGERVVQPEANTKLTKFLDKQTSGQSNVGDITVNAPLIVQGDVAGDDAKFNEMLKKHANSVTQAVRSSQKRNT
jgi:DNA-binding transcriptional MerR regulator